MPHSHSSQQAHQTIRFSLCKPVDDLGSVASLVTADNHALSLGLLHRGHWRRTLDGSLKVLYAGGLGSVIAELLLQCNTTMRSAQAVVLYAGNPVPNRFQFVLQHECACSNVTCGIGHAFGRDAQTSVEIAATKHATEHCKAGSMQSNADCDPVTNNEAVTNKDSSNSIDVSEPVISTDVTDPKTDDVENLDESQMLLADFAQLELLVSQGWETELVFSKRDTRQYQSAVRSLLSLFYGEVELAGLSDGSVLRSAASIEKAVDSATAVTVQKFKPKGLSSTEIREAQDFLKVHD